MGDMQPPQRILQVVARSIHGPEVGIIAEIPLAVGFIQSRNASVRKIGTNYRIQVHSLSV